MYSIRYIKKQANRQRKNLKQSALFCQMYLIVFFARIMKKARQSLAFATVGKAAPHLLSPEIRYKAYFKATVKM